jgi:hypothetical protein
MALSEITWRRIIREELAAITRIPGVVPRLPPDVVPVAPPMIKFVEVTGKPADVQIDVSPTAFPVTITATLADTQIENNVAMSISVEVRIE